MVEKRKGTKLIHSFKDGERVVSMLEFKGVIYLATNYHVYTMKNGKVTPIEFRLEAG